jgi:oligopeptide/dipeptide ABC transporter ATP-binding protein
VNNMPLFELNNVSVVYAHGKKKLQALQNISLSAIKNETLGIVGESGSGKSTLAKALLYLEKPQKGAVFFNGQNLGLLNSASLRSMRKGMQMVFQDPDSSLNPRMTIYEHLTEALNTHGLLDRKQQDVQIKNLLEMVQLSFDCAHRYPFEISGGQKQRVAIARAFSVEPELVVLDEPLSSLDVSVRVQIIHLLQELQQKRKLGYLFISHDLSTLRFLAHRIGVLYLGNLVEIAPTQALYEKPLHPYTQALLSAILIPDPYVEKKRERIILKGSIPSPHNPPSGCPFHTRCPFAKEICKQKRPELKEIEPGHLVACHLVTVK